MVALALPALLLATTAAAGWESDAPPRTVDLWIWSGGGTHHGKGLGPECAVCTLLNASDDSCALHPCAESDGDECIDGQSCDFLPPIVAEALEKEKEPFLTGVMAFMGIGLNCVGRVPAVGPVRSCNLSTFSRPDPPAYLRARATAQSLHRRGIAFYAQSNGMSIAQIRSFLYNETSIAAFVRGAVDDAVEFGLDGCEIVILSRFVCSPSRQPLKYHYFQTTSTGSGLGTRGERTR